MEAFKKNNKALCVLNFSGRYGGAEKRYATLFNRLMDEGRDYYLIINRGLYQLFIDSTLLREHERILIFEDGTKGSVHEIKAEESRDKTEMAEKSQKSRLRLFLGRWKYFFFTLLLWLRFSRFFVRQVRKIRITKLYGVWQGGIWTWMWCKQLKIHLVYSVNASEKLMLYKDVVKFFDSQYRVLQNADALDFLSPSLIDDYRRAMDGRLKGKILKTPNSFIDFTNYYAVAPKMPWVVFLGRLEPLKNPMLFIEAINQLVKDARFRDAKFFIMGNGSMLSRLREYASDQHFENIVFTGLHPKPWEILQQSSVFVSLQNSENYPSQSLMEAMACENGVVVTDVGDTRLLVSENEGLLVDHDYMQVAGAIAKLIDNKQLREALGKSARQKVMTTQTLEKFVHWFDAVMD